MQTETTTNHYLRAAVVFGACLMAVFLLPFIGLFLNSSVLFFAPQFLFPFDSLVVRGADSSRAVFSHHVALALTWFEWGFAAIGLFGLPGEFQFVTRFLPQLPLLSFWALPTNVAFRLFGVMVELDGP